MNTFQIAIARTGFIVSLVSYAVFWMMDALHPGFVSRFFSVHVFLACALLFGLWLLALGAQRGDRPMHTFFASIPLALLAGFIAWIAIAPGPNQYALILLAALSTLAAAELVLRAPST